MPRALNVYYASDLFNHKQLVGTAMVADNVSRLSEGRYRPILPQDFEQTQMQTPLRNRLLAELFSCDALIFNFDAAPDPSTIAAFIYAKILDIPAVLLRTNSASPVAVGDKDYWALIGEGYPRCSRLCVDTQKMYLAYRRPGRDCAETLKLYTEDLARQIIMKLDASIRLKSLYGGNNPLAVQTYDWAVKSCGAGLEKLLTPERIAEIVERKLVSGLI